MRASLPPHAPSCPGARGLTLQPDLVARRSGQGASMRWVRRGGPCMGSDSERGARERRMMLARSLDPTEETPGLTGGVYLTACIGRGFDPIAATLLPADAAW